MVLFLSGDIGATNSRLALWQYEGNSEQPYKTKTYPSQKYAHLNDIITIFLKENKINGEDWPRAAVLAVAGPVQNNACFVTNVKWQLTGEEMERDLNIPKVLLINDFVAIGYAVSDIPAQNLIPLQEAKADPKGPIAVIGAGTGLGECYLTHGGEDYTTWPTEGGHTTFAAQTELEFKLCQYIKNKHKLEHVSAERLVSGMGIPDIYEFLTKEFPQLVDKDIENAVRGAADQSKEICVQGKAHRNSLAGRTVDIFVTLYGAEAGNLALKTLPTGGLYLAGGIAPSIMWAMKEDDRFLSAFRAKGRMSRLVSTLPIYVITDKDVGLRGSKVLCRRIIQKKGLAGAKSRL